MLLTLLSERYLRLSSNISLTAVTPNTKTSGRIWTSFANAVTPNHIN